MLSFIRSEKVVEVLALLIPKDWKRYGESNSQFGRRCPIAMATFLDGFMHDAYSYYAWDEGW